MVENKGVIDSIKRSWSLSEDHRLYIFLIQLLFSIIQFISQLLVMGLTAVLTGGNYIAYVIVGNILYLGRLSVLSAWGSMYVGW